MHVHFVVSVILEDDDRQALSTYQHHWHAPYDPPENLDGMCDELAEVVAEKLVELDQIPPK